MIMHCDNVWCLRKDYIGDSLKMDNEVVGKIIDVTEDRITYDISDEYNEIFMKGKGTCAFTLHGPVENIEARFTFDKRRPK